MTNETKYAMGAGIFVSGAVIGLAGMKDIDVSPPSYVSWIGLAIMVVGLFFLGRSARREYDRLRRARMLR